MSPQASSVAALQRQWLQRLERVSPNDRLILAQTHKECPWLPWRLLPVDAVLWTRSLLANELLFETDNPDKAFNESCARRLAFAASLHGAKPLVADGGGKSWHVHIWIDPDLELDAETVDAAALAGVDVWRVVRETLYDRIVDAADLPKDPKGHHARLDRAKIAWTADKKGSMVREFGTPGSTGAPKTLKEPWPIAAWWDGGSMAVFPVGDPPLWRPDDVASIEKALKRAISKAHKASKLETLNVSTLGGFEAHPCIATALKHGAPAGERNPTGLHLLKVARAEGLTETQATEALQRYLAACGLPPDDKLAGRVSAIYAEAPSAIACPNPIGLSVCDQSAPCPRRALVLGSGFATNRF